jgi:predicted protein tyrosine phosphatase
MIVVCGLNAAQSQIHLHGAKSVISILSPDTPHRDFMGIDKHLRLTFNDVNAAVPGLVAPQSADAVRLVEFIRNWDRASPLLIHCWAGISRSTASAFAALCILQPHISEMSHAKTLRQAAPSATPNRLITAQVDQLLGRDGRMSEAVEAIGRGADAFEGTPFILNIGFSEGKATL